jgi:hypothetical protein
MLRKFRIWLADVIRPCDLETDSSNRNVDLSWEDIIKQEEKYPDEGISVDYSIPTKIVTNRRLKESDHIHTKTFAMILGVSRRAITDWENGKYKSPVGNLPSHSKTSEKHPVLWDRVECLVFASVYRCTSRWTESQISMLELGQILGITPQAAYHAAAKWHKANKNRSSWNIDDKSSRRVINRSHAIEIGLERAGLRT